MDGLDRGRLRLPRGQELDAIGARLVARQARVPQVDDEGAPHGGAFQGVIVFVERLPIPVEHMQPHHQVAVRCPGRQIVGCHFSASRKPSTLCSCCRSSGMWQFLQICCNSSNFQSI